MKNLIKNCWEFRRSGESRNSHSYYWKIYNGWSFKFRSSFMSICFCLQKFQRRDFEQFIGNLDEINQNSYFLKPAFNRTKISVLLVKTHLLVVLQKKWNSIIFWMYIYNEDHTPKIMRLIKELILRIQTFTTLEPSSH